MNASGPGATSDPDYRCEICDDTRWLNTGAPFGSPDFGKVYPCECQELAWGVRRSDRLRDYSDLGPLARLTFDNLIPTGRDGHVDATSFRRAADAAMSFAANPTGWLVISGPSGAGKTHLAAAVAGACVQNGLPARFVAVPDLLDHLRSAFDPGADAPYDDEFTQVIHAPLLILDDLGIQSATPWADEKLDQILTHRFNERMPTMITAAASMDRLGDRMRTRLMDPGLSTFVEIYPGAGSTDRSDVGIEPRMLRTMLFDTFDPRGGSGATSDHRESLREALKAAEAFAEDPNGWLYLAGPTGAGKTHLAVSIANARLKQRQPVLFRFVPDLLDDLRRSFSPDNTERYDLRFDRIKNCELLILDDLGSQSTTPWAAEKLYQVIVHRHNAALPTVITSQILLENLHESGGNRLIARYSEAIASRLRDAHVVAERLLHAPDFRHRGAARPAKSRSTRTQHRSG